MGPMDIPVSFEELRMAARQPIGEEIETPPPALGANPGPPGGPALDDPAEAQAADDLTVGRMLEKPHRRPIPVQPSKLGPSVEQGLEGLLVNVVVPNVGQAAHGSIIKHGAADPRPPTRSATSAGVAESPYRPSYPHSRRPPGRRSPGAAACRSSAAGRRGSRASSIRRRGPRGGAARR